MTKKQKVTFFDRLRVFFEKKNGLKFDFRGPKLFWQRGVKC